MEFLNPYTHNFIRTAVCIPEVRVADPEFNASQTIDLMQKAADRGVWLAVFPELGLTAYTCDDLFHQRSLLDAAESALRRIVTQSANLSLVSVVGLPISVDGLLFNCAATVHGGRIVGVSAKTYPPNYREYYELRYFAPGETCLSEEVSFCGQNGIPFGTRLLYCPSGQTNFVFYTEICEDLWSTIPPSSYAALAGANVLVNLSASNVTIGKNQYRQQLVANQSARCIAAYLYSAAGFGESTTDLAWDGHGIVAENGTILKESERYKYDSQMVIADIDLDRLQADRMRDTSFRQSVVRHRDELMRFRKVAFTAQTPDLRVPTLEREVLRYPYVPTDVRTRDERCHEVLEIQVQGLVKRLKAMGSDKLVIGISGGLDSTHALVVCARAMDVLKLPRTNILAFTMPAFATSDRTLGQARRLMSAFGCTAQELDIRPSCQQMMRDIGHPFINGERVYDITFENVQAGERTSHLFRLANVHRAPVIGTSDLSEIALGWCTYGVGDHMAHYHVNASVPKTLIQYLIVYVVRANVFGTEVANVLTDVLATEISPELIPSEKTGAIGQRTEDAIGPYALHDFFLYYTLRFGYSPAKVAFLSYQAWHDKSSGAWPPGMESRAVEYDLPEIKRWLRLFLQRFFATSQFKRSVAPNAPKIGSGGSLSPRGDWRAPSDGVAAPWIHELESIPLPCED